MKTMHLSLLSGLAGIFLIAFVAPAQAPPKAGRVLLLDNDQLIEGEIRQIGNQYHIRRDTGETIIPADRVVEVVSNRGQAFAAMRKRSNLRDPDERLRLIRWAMENDLRKEALAEAEHLLNARPSDEKVRLLVQGLKALPPRDAKLAPDRKASVKPVAAVVEIEPVEYNRDSFPTFVTKVQPILMNTCASCHVGKADGFSLLHVSDGGNRKSALINLAATLKQLNRGDVMNSPLLVKAVTPHGKAPQAPIHDQQALPFQFLHSWAVSAIGSESITPAEGASNTHAAERPKIDSKIEPAKNGPATRFADTSTTEVKPEVQTEAKDQFDPAIFNGTIKPKK